MMKHLNLLVVLAALLAPASSNLLAQSEERSVYVTVVDKAARRKGNEGLAKAYLEHLYSDEGQEIAAKNFYRPRNEVIAKKYAQQFPTLKLVTIDEIFGGWSKAQKKHFSDGGVFDEIQRRSR